MFTRILLASDGSGHALCAPRSAAALARQFPAKLVVVYVSTKIAQQAKCSVLPARAEERTSTS